MNRKEFLKLSCGACLSLAGLSMLLEGCGGVHYVQGTSIDSRLRLAKSDFVVIKKEETTYRRYVVTGTDTLDYPIVVYRLSDVDYIALLLRCSHQGTELNVHGDLLVCPAHGSEFNDKGEVVQGPAERNLRAFPVTADQNYVYIQLQ
jgi:Rieske Fe-S protein